ncbi:MAG TPA: DNA polymerase IV [Verrucomicrobiae bacterium]|nr:DNA polymerase IV [Verrucomicrobiae bacterium]
MPRTIFHLDMDAFYAAIEQRDNPDLRGKPVIVGAPPSRRGVVCAASYEARKFGVRSAMPSATAGRLCPDGLFIYPRMEVYRTESHHIMDIVARTDGAIEQVSIDEAYIELPDVPDLYAAVPIAKQLKAQIQAERHLTASIGIASNKFLAKLASDFKKPDGLTLIPDRDKVAFLAPLPVRVIPGVGRVTEETLHRAGIHTLADLQNAAGDLRELVGSFGPTLKLLALGEDDRIVDTSDEVKSISSEETFDSDTSDRQVLRNFLRSSANELSEKLKCRHLAAHTVQVKVRYSDFTTLTRQISVEDPITGSEQIYRLGCHLLARHKLVTRPLRLLGLGVSGLVEPVAEQLLLLERG